VLHINWKAQTLPVITGGLPSRKKAAKLGERDWMALPQPAVDKLIPISPLAQIVRGNYRTPTFLVHGTSDDLIPWQQSQVTYNALLEQGVASHLQLVPNGPHVCDLSSDTESDGWKAVLKGYEFLCSYVF
jgi:acetyl esterase/lipase